MASRQRHALPRRIVPATLLAFTVAGSSQPRSLAQRRARSFTASQPGRRFIGETVLFAGMVTLPITSALSCVWVTP